MQITHEPAFHFPHRINPDGTFDAICPICFRTIAHQRDEASLQRLEKTHVCRPEDILIGGVPVN
jgi:hypothetical protein